MTEPMAEALTGRYRIERELGRGGMATVYLAMDLKHHRQVAIKVLRPDLAASLGADRFLREIEIAARLSHPHILQLHDSGEAGGHLFYAMPYVEGESLRQRLEREGQLPIGEVIAIVRAVASALTYAHQHGVIHRDIKPENILLAKDSEGGAAHPLVADFGIARALDTAGGERLTETGLALGTPAYMSPEQAASGRLDGRSDIYALGCVAYEMLAGQPPFTGPTSQSILARHALDSVPPLHTVRSTIPPSVEAAIERALAKVPADRFATAEEFAQALTARDLNVLRSRWRLNRKMKLVLGIVAVTAAAVTGAVKLRRSTSAVVPSAASMAVLPFSAAGPDTGLTRLGRDLAVTVSASLDGIGGIVTSDRLRVAQHMAGRKALSIEDAAGIARRLGASSFVRGTVVQAGQSVRLDLGLYTTAGNAPLAKGISITAHRDSIGTLTDSAAWALLRQIWKRGEPPSPSLAAVTTRSLPALRVFLDGEREVEKDQWEAAALAFSSAIAADSTFWLAYFRYALAQYWREQEVEPHVTHALQLHRDAFPERERLLIHAWNTEGPGEFDRYRELTHRFPDYWPGWFMLGDRIYHSGPLHGISLKESQVAFGRAVALNPHLKPAWVHLLGFAVREDTVESKRALARILELSHSNSSESPTEHDLQRHRILRLEESLARSGGLILPSTNALADSVARDWASLEATPFQRQMAAWALLWFGFPVAEVDWSRRVLRVGPRLQYPANLFRGMAWAWAERGAWDSALATINRAVRVEPHPQDPAPPTALDEYGLAVLGTWLGAIGPVAATARRTSALAFIAGLEDGERRRNFNGALAWLDGMLAFAQRDHEALERARQEGRRSGHPNINMIDRSLVAFGRALAGDRTTAGRELAAMEWSWLRSDYGDFAIPNIALHRLAAATWLLEAGDTAQAARLLIWHQSTAVSGWEASFSYVVTPWAYLMLARIEEAQGNTRLAVKHYNEFLRRHDMPLPGQRHLIAEARSAVERLSGRNDPSATQ
jgi:serine/threonine-protein kinase